MRYSLGVDLGTTYTAAAVARDGRSEIFTLGTTAPSIPSVVVVRADGEVLVGEPAERRSITEPTRTAREFKRRLGDPAPLILGGTPFGAEALMARLLRFVVDAVKEREGGPPSAITVTHPANYGPYKRDLLTEMVRLADVGEVRFLTEPEAAAIEYASQNRIEPGEVVAVYDFGGGTFDAAVLRRTETGFEILGTPEGMERLGGIDFDQAVFQHVDDATGGQLSELDTSDAQTRAALSRLRADVRAAKESLSSDTDVTIPVMLPTVQTHVRLTRTEFEQMIRPRVAETISAFQRAVRSAGVPLADISRVLLVGGSSRIPLVAEMVRETTGRPVVVDAHPKFAIALGAARFGAATLSQQDAAAADITVVVPVASATAAPATPVSTRVTTTPPVEREPEGRRSPVMLIAAIVGLLVVGGIAFFGLGLGGGTPPASPGRTAAVGVGQSPGGPGTPAGVVDSPPAGPATPPEASQALPTNVSGTPPPTTPASAVPTVAPSASAPGSTPAGPVAGIVSQVAPDAGFDLLGALSIGSDGRIYVTDQTLALRVGDADGSFTTVRTLSELSGAGPFDPGIDVLDDGSLIATSPGTHQVFRIAPDGTATRIAGRADAQAGTEGGNGPAEQAELWEPVGVAVAPDGSIYISEYTNNRIALIDPSGNMSTVAGGGVGTGGFGGDGGPAEAAQISGPALLALDSTGALYFIDVANNRIRRIDADGTISTVLGTGADLAQEPVDGVAATDQPITRNTEALAVDAAGNLYTFIEGFVVRVTPDGTVDVLAGGGDDVFAIDVPPDQVLLGRVRGLAVHPTTGDLYIADGVRLLVLPGVGAVE